MDKRKLIAQVAKKSCYAKWEISKITDFILESISETLQKGEEINIKGFGRFEPKVRKARNTIHPRSKQPIQIPEKVSVVFTISKRFTADDGVIEKIKSKSETSD